MILLAAAASGIVAGLIQLLRSAEVIHVPVSNIGWWLVGLGATGALGRYLHLKVPNWKQQAALLGMAVTGAALARLHAKVLDPAYLKAGRRDRLSK
jgi:hypothetical protein